MGYIKKVAGIGRRKRGEKKNNSFLLILKFLLDILSIIDLSTFDNNDEFVYGKAPEYITKDKVKFLFLFIFSLEFSRFAIMKKNKVYLYHLLIAQYLFLYIFNSIL